MEVAAAAAPVAAAEAEAEAAPVAAAAVPAADPQPTSNNVKLKISETVMNSLNKLLTDIDNDDRRK